MNSEQILQLLNRKPEKHPEVAAIVEELSSNSMLLLSEKPGSYTAKELLSELTIRNSSMKNAGIKSIGMTALKSHLTALPQDDVVKNYTFKASDKTCLVYLNEHESNAVGTLIIEA